MSAPKGGMYFDEGVNLTGDQFRAAIDAIDDNLMPKGRPPLSSEEKYGLLRELRKLRPDSTVAPAPAN